MGRRYVVLRIAWNSRFEKLSDPIRIDCDGIPGNQNGGMSGDRGVARAQGISFAAEEFEPFVGRIIGPDVLDRVIANGWVESGWSCRPAVGKVGHRLTALGWEKFERTFY